MNGLVLTGSLLIGAVLGCPSGWLVHDNKCYHFSHDTETWVGAMTFCSGLGGQLVEINDAKENTFLKAQAAALTYDFWIGLTDVMNEAEWVWWTSKTPLTPSSFSDWHPGQPDNAGKDENCGHLYHGFNYDWNDYPCHTFQHYICEAPDENVEVVG